MHHGYLTKKGLFRWGIAQKFIFCIFIFCALLTVMITAGQLYVGYKNGIKSIEKNLRQIEETYLVGIKKSIWIVDIELLKAQIDGMMKLPDMQYIRVWDHKKIIAETGNFKTGNIITKEFDLSFNHQGQVIPLGTLQVGCTLENIYHRLFLNTAAIICSQSAIVILISCFIFFIFYRLVARHLYDLVNYTGTLSVDTLTTPFHLKRTPSKWGEDELEELTKAVNLMRTNLDESYRRLKAEISEREQAEKLFRESETHLRTLIDSLPDLVWLKDPQGIFLSCNAKVENLYGAKESQIIGRTDYDFVEKPLADFFREKDRAAIEKGGPSVNEEKVRYAHDGHTELLETIKTPVFDDNGTLIGILGVGRDITARKKAEEEKIRLETELQQAQKIEAVGRLAGGVAHDFNNMLSIILGNTDIILEDASPSDAFIGNLNEIHRAAERSADLTRQLLAFARKQTIAPKVLDLNEAVDGMLKMLKRLIGEDIDLVWHPCDDLWKIKIDPSQIDQILANFCVNARDAIKSVGNVTIETANANFDRAYCEKNTGFRPGKYVLMAFSDNGMGMDQNTLENIFEPFFTTKETGEGTGLGLSTVYGIVKQNSGFIKVDSKPGQGSTFQVYFPRYEAPVEKSVAVEPQIRKGSETVLLVEDEIPILKMTQTMLERLSYKVLPASTPEKALQVAENLEPDTVQLLITDVVMPEMNGKDLAEKITLLHPEIKCLFMSGYTADVIAHHGILDEGIGFIHKPFSSKELASKIWATLHPRNPHAG